MTLYVLRRLGFLVLTLIITSIIIFSITQLLPGDVASIILGREAGEEALQVLREDLGLDEPAYVQYGTWLMNFLQGDWGESFSTQVDVFTMVMQRLRNSLMLAAVTLVLAVPLSVALGVVAGLREGKLLDSTINIGSLAVVGLPEFVTGLVLIQIFAFGLKWFPANSSIRAGAGFLEVLPMLILPALTATLVLLAYIIRLTRAGVVEELKASYVRTADLKGLPRNTVVIKHVLRNALLPTITIIAVSVGWMISGLVVIENVFNYPGLGRLLVFAIERRDLPIIQAVALITVLGFALANLAADLLSAFLNPRVRFE
ncbi:MAG: ABC transporter permease subunit [Anaerolineales bacterium]|nr:ABC transporter permease subunit [Anaerolineales bacterium]